MAKDIIAHQINGLTIGQRNTDGYVNATRLSKAYEQQTGKRRDVHKWLTSKRTQEMIAHLSSVTQIGVTGLYQVIQGGVPELQGTWIHPKLATRFAIWLSDDFGLMVENWVESWMTKGKDTHPEQLSPAQAILEMAKFMVAQEQKTRELEAKIALEAQRTAELEETILQHDAELDRIFNPYGHYYSVIGYANKNGLTNVTFSKAKELGKRASDYCRQNNIPIEKINDPRFGTIGSYPENVLEIVFG